MHYIECKYTYKKKLVDFNLLLLFTISSVVLTLSPGPDILFVFSTSLSKGWRKGVMVSAGLTSGLWIHTLLVVLGVGNFLTQYPQSQRVIEYLGGMYLLFLAYRVLNSSRSESGDNNTFSRSSKKQRFFLSGLIMNLTNPKVSLFFISFFPGFLFHESWSYGQQFLALGALFFLQAFIIFFAVVVFADVLGKKFSLEKESLFWNKFQAVALAIIALILFYP